MSEQQEAAEIGKSDLLSDVLDCRVERDYAEAIKNIDTIDGFNELLTEYRFGLGKVHKRRRLIESEIEKLENELNEIKRNYPGYGDIEGTIFYEMGKLCASGQAN